MYARAFHEDWSESIKGSQHEEAEYALTKADWERRGASGFPSNSGKEGTSA